MTKKQIGGLIKDLRLKKNLTQKQLAAKSGTSQNAIATIESGDRNISIDVLDKLFKALKITWKIIIP